MPVLPDEILLAIFDFYLEERQLEGFDKIEASQLLVHVCRSAVAKRYFWITSLPQFATHWYTQNTCEEQA
jgi:hypothetical protein